MGIGARFKDSWNVYFKANPGIKSAMTDFDRCKRANPPTSLPINERSQIRRTIKWIYGLPFS
jgi:hypothetical protein